MYSTVLSSYQSIFQRGVWKEQEFDYAVGGITDISQNLDLYTCIIEIVK